MALGYGLATKRARERKMQEQLNEKTRRSKREHRKREGMTAIAAKDRDGQRAGNEWKRRRMVADRARARETAQPTETAANSRVELNAVRTRWDDVNAFPKSDAN